MWKWLTGIGLVLLTGCAGGGYWLYSSGTYKQLEEKFNPASKALEVRLETPAKGELIRVVSAPGQVEARTKVQVSSQVSARIIKLPYKGGEHVKKGDLLVQLDDRDLKAALDAAAADKAAEMARLEGTRAQLSNLQVDLGRKRELFSTKDIPKSDLDTAETAVLQTQAAVAAAEHGIESAEARIVRARRDLENTTIIAEFDGTVTKVSAEAGELVMIGTLNNPSSVIMEVADLSNMIVRARVDESNIAPIELNQKSRVYINAFRNIDFDGQVQRIIPQMQLDRDGTKYFEVEVLINIPSGVALKTGMTANVDIQVQVLSDVIKVPSQAIVDRAIDELPKAVVDASPHLDRAKKLARVVYKLVDGKAVSAPVSVGASDLTTTVVLAGISTSDQLVVGPAKTLINLKDGTRLTKMPDTKPVDAASGKEKNKPDEPAGPDGHR